jgi:Sec-independent protein translocase protein TatA
MLDLAIVLVIAAVIFGPRTLWQLRRRHRSCT